MKEQASQRQTKKDPGSQARQRRTKSLKGRLSQVLDPDNEGTSKSLKGRLSQALEPDNEGPSVSRQTKKKLKHTLRPTTLKTNWTLFMARNYV